ncbi:hypothetical protein [Shewanella algidipiscicola]|uniref:Uncharacterized protein n=1 Tax=Shewanella algidipiscicola TaxID=614070 RepID=A0ABQ4P2S6_9GAMM|nr:hypothetical protein [Shewanella algidipiscicola]GIU41812.1 hypothetical protein TUM4630_01330 [Shewanella algidipiscicola]
MDKIKQFSISRIHTAKGIFRLQGAIKSHGEHAHINYEKAEFMGTDGWRELDLTSAETLAILAGIHHSIIEHIKPQGL